SCSSIRGAGSRASATPTASSAGSRSTPASSSAADGHRAAPSARVKIPILAYQSMRVDAGGYRHNDLEALAGDLREIAAAGYQVVALHRVVDAWLAGRTRELDAKLVAITCDGGVDFTGLDLEHPRAGPQRSLLSILRDFAS